MNITTNIHPLKIERDRLLILNQIKLPHQEEWIICKNEKEVAESIQKMHVRGAPAIGIAAAYGFYLGLWNLISQDKNITLVRIKNIKKTLNSSRPTAINLFWATDKMYRPTLQWFYENKSKRKKDTMGLLLQSHALAEKIHEEDAFSCIQMAKNGFQYLEQNHPKKRYRILTHCNAGALATGGIGTTLGLIRYLHSKDKVENVFVDETRPYLQGSRLTAYELMKEKISATLIVDSMAGYVMKKNMVDFIIVGADRITSNGDVANKIGTYSLSVLAKEHNIPFFVIAPRSTVDLNLKSGEDIPIEEREATEVTHIQDTHIAAKIEVLNYSFDVTPRKNITAIFLEDEIF